MRGEDSVARQDGPHACGSPPHARGRPVHRRGGALVCRITPACAGKTQAESLGYVLGADHPRMRGEDELDDSGNRSDGGSPPHARGRLFQHHLPKCEHRITPACAGKTIVTQPPLALSGDHPRMRGEDGACPQGLEVLGGSPPHARGRRSTPGRQARRERITPACAGKTPSSRPTSPSFRDHPRMRGEDGSKGTCIFRHCGSPPHARGRLAGSGTRNSRGTDHPRMRGEDPGGLTVRICECGSPPHARGRPYGLPVDNVVPRITPACAGKTIIVFAFEFKHWDHPRMRGEDHI